MLPFLSEPPHFGGCLKDKSMQRSSTRNDFMSLLKMLACNAWGHNFVSLDLYVAGSGFSAETDARKQELSRELLDLKILKVHQVSRKTFSNSVIFLRFSMHQYFHQKLCSGRSSCSKRHLTLSGKCFATQWCQQNTRVEFSSARVKKVGKHALSGLQIKLANK